MQEFPLDWFCDDCGRYYLPKVTHPNNEDRICPVCGHVMRQKQEG